MITEHSAKFQIQSHSMPRGEIEAFSSFSSRSCLFQVSIVAKKNSTLVDRNACVPFSISHLDVPIRHGSRCDCLLRNLSFGFCRFLA